MNAVSDPTGWRVREAGDEDAPALSLIGSATFLETFAGILDGDAVVAHCAAAHSPEAYRRYMEGGARAWLAGADLGGAPVGFALLGAPDLPGAREGDVELKRIYALSRFHGSGVGSALLDAALEAARAGFKRLLLGVYAGNHRAIAFYAKHGFVKIADRRFDVGGTLYDDIVHARPL